MDLSLKIIKSYGFPEEISKPDWDDVQLTITLPNGLELSTLTVCFNEPTNCNSLEGLDGYIYISTKEELDELISISYIDILRKISAENSDFDISKYLYEDE